MNRSNFQEIESQPILQDRNFDLDWESFKKQYYSKENMI